VLVVNRFNIMFLFLFHCSRLMTRIRNFFKIKYRVRTKVCKTNKQKLRPKLSLSQLADINGNNVFLHFDTNWRLVVVLLLRRV